MTIKTEEKRQGSTHGKEQTGDPVAELPDLNTSTQVALEEAARSLAEQVETLAGHEYDLRTGELPAEHRAESDPSLSLNASRSEVWDTLVSPLSYDQWEEIVTSCQERLREVANFDPRHAMTVQRAINSLDDCLRFICAEDLEGAESALVLAANSFGSIRAMAQYEKRNQQSPDEEFAMRTLSRALVEFESALESMKDYLVSPNAERDPAKLWGMWNALSDGVMIIHAAQRMQESQEGVTHLVPRFHLELNKGSGRKAG